MGRWLDTFRAEYGSDSASPIPAKNAENAKNPRSVPDIVHFGKFGIFGTGVERAEDGGGNAHGPGVLANLAFLARGVEGQNTPARDEQDMRDDYQERAAILEFCANLPRAEAERIAWAEVFGTDTPMETIR